MEQILGDGEAESDQSRLPGPSPRGMDRGVGDAAAKPGFPNAQLEEDWRCAFRNVFLALSPNDTKLMQTRCLSVTV